MIEIEGTIESIVYRNDENGYTVAKMENNKKIISVVGCMPFINEGHKVKITGDWTTHATFGEQIKVETCEEIVPSTIDGVENYLASGLVIGIGPVTAKRIVEKFGMDTLDIMEMNPMRLTEVEGIGEKKAAAIAENFKDQRELRQVMVFLQSYGITPNFAIRIYKKYGIETIKTVNENPYRLCDDINGIGFKTADKIARNLGVDPSSKYRIMSGIKYILSGCTANGHVYLPKLNLLDECSKILGLNEEMINEALVSLLVSKELCADQMEEDTAIYLSTMYYSELGVARKLIELSLYGDEQKESEDDIINEINEFENGNDIEFGEEQRQAIVSGVKNCFSIITGGPGTGKTTIIKCIISIFEKKGMNIVLGAPTGRAAKRITETTGYEAKTIHRLLEMGYAIEDGDGNGNANFTKDESDPIEAEVIIIDEASMIDILLMNSLLKALALGTRVIMVGDVDQLPSVGPGNVLKDIIESKAVNVVKLKKIYRQSNESLITLNAHKINSGEMPELNDKGKDFFFIQKSNGNELLEELLTLAHKRLPAFKEGFDFMKDIQVLAPMRKGEVGINNLNNRLQQMLNPALEGKVERKFKDYLIREGDKVMQIRNNYSVSWESLTNGDEGGSGIYNGDIGYIENIDNEAQSVTVIFDEEKRVKYDFVNLDELELAYAITIHKSQGSEFPIVIIPVWNGPPMLMNRNLIYTAVTRAKKLVVLVGSRQVLAGMVKNNRIAARHTRLKDRIESIVEIINNIN
jgi:exodeoxyribonuclease V alpha subunit